MEIAWIVYFDDMEVSNLRYKYIYILQFSFSIYMQKNDNLVIQIAVAMIIIALMGITVMRARSAQQTVALPRVVDTTMPAGDVARSDFNEFKFADQVARQDVSSVEDLPRLVENLNSDEANIVKAYFAAMEAKDFARACSLVSTDKCRATNPRSVELFAREYQKLSNGYEYLAIKDL